MFASCCVFMKLKMSLYPLTQQITCRIYNNTISYLLFSTMTRFNPLDRLQVVTIYKLNLKLQKR